MLESEQRHHVVLNMIIKLLKKVLTWQNSAETRVGLSSLSSAGIFFSLKQLWSYFGSHLDALTSSLLLVICTALRKKKFLFSNPGLLPFFSDMHRGRCLAVFILYFTGEFTTTTVRKTSRRYWIISTVMLWLVCLRAWNIKSGKTLFNILVNLKQNGVLKISSTPLSLKQKKMFHTDGK